MENMEIKSLYRCTVDGGKIERSMYNTVAEGRSACAFFERIMENGCRVSLVLDGNHEVNFIKTDDGVWAVSERYGDLQDESNEPIILAVYEPGVDELRKRHDVVSVLLKYRKYINEALLRPLPKGTGRIKSRKPTDLYRCYWVVNGKNVGKMNASLTTGDAGFRISRMVDAEHFYTRMMCNNSTVVIIIDNKKEVKIEKGKEGYVRASIRMGNLADSSVKPAVVASTYPGENHVMTVAKVVFEYKKYLNNDFFI